MRAALTVLSITIVFGSPAAHAQYTAKEWPEGPSKARFAATCDGCHDINRIRVGYTAEGWLSVVRMMQNVNAPVPAEEWGAMTDYLIKNFPERSRPPAAIIDGPVKADIRMWDVPTLGSRPHDPLAARDGSIWWTGQLANKLGRLDPKTGAIREYTLKSAAHRAARPGRRQERQYLVHRQQRRADRQARSVHRPSHRIPAAGRQRKGSAHAQFRPERNPVVHGPAGEHDRTARSRNRRDQARDLSDAEVAALWSQDQRPGRACCRRIRYQQDCNHRSPDDGDQGICATEPGRPAAAACDRS